MCIGGGGKAVQLPSVAAPVVRRGQSPLNELFTKRRKGARGVFSNIFTGMSGATPSVGVGVGLTTLGGAPAPAV